MIVKICGITRLEDAEVAVECGAAAIGFVFWPKSPRFIDPFRARLIAARLPPFVAVTGVFVNQTVEYVNSVAGVARLTVVQLHGDERPEVARAVEHPVLKALHALDDETLSQWPAHVTILADADDGEKRGGTGRRADWRRATEVAGRRRLLLAGGLTPGNVAEAIAMVRPFGIDVSSGVESAPGVKDHRLMTALFKAVDAS